MGNEAGIGFKISMFISSSSKKYEVRIENDASFFVRLLQTPNAFFVISKKVYELYPLLFQNIKQDDLLVLEGCEENKTIEVALAICDRMVGIPAKRNATLISVGGGSVQDVTGFVASVLYRGIHWIYVPTTLLSACDSCIGGKTSLNYMRYKNLLGTFYPPDAIFVWPGFFKTLSILDFKSGLGELVKFNIMSGADGLCAMETNLDHLINRDIKLLGQFVEKSLLFKKIFIEADEFDRGERVKLNFAHTFGHAIETVTDYQIPHGTAVAIGMIMANHISCRRGFLENSIRLRAEDLLLRIIDIDSSLLDRPVSVFLDAIRKDKKQTSEAITGVLITKFGKETELTVFSDIQIVEIESALNYFLTCYEAKKND